MIFFKKLWVICQVLLFFWKSKQNVQPGRFSLFFIWTAQERSPGYLWSNLI